MRTGLLIAPVLLLAACSGSSPDGQMASHRLRPVTQAAPAQKAALLDRVKTLAGTWESPDEQGNVRTASVFAVTSNGSAVREVMFPGSDHEMTNMYTMDGEHLVVTHYCAMGNQPHMRSVSSGTDRIAFGFDGVSNLASREQMYMGEMTLVFVDADHIRQEWKSFKNGTLADHSVAFTLTRKH